MCRHNKDTELDGRERPPLEVQAFRNAWDRQGEDGSVVFHIRSDESGFPFDYKAFRGAS